MGFQYLNPPFTIRAVSPYGNDDSGEGGLFMALKIRMGKKASRARLPSAATCFNLLRLPMYMRFVLLFIRVVLRLFSAIILWKRKSKKSSNLKILAFFLLEINSKSILWSRFFFLSFFRFFVVSPFGTYE
jgi:hypothetical protein